MKIERPRFELTRVYSDGTKDEPEIVPVTQMPWDTKMRRRGFLGVGIGAASLLLLLDGKATAQIAQTKNQTDNVPVKVPDKVLKAHKVGISAMAISPDGKILASCASDNTFKLWTLPEGKLLSSPEGFNANVLAVVFSPDGKFLVLGLDNNTIKLWSLSESKVLTTFQGHQRGVMALVISPDGKILVSGSWDNTIKLWSIPEGKLLTTLQGHSNGVRVLALSPDGKTLISGSGDGNVKLWSLPDGNLVTTFVAHKEGPYDGVSGLAISPNGKTLVSSASASDTIKLWSLPEKKLLATLQGGRVFDLEISPDGRILVSGSSDKIIKLWSLPEGKKLFNLEAHKEAITELDVSRDGKLLASGDVEGVIILWDFEKHSFLSFLFDPKVNESDAISYNQFDKITGRTITFTLPCGSPIPQGAVCTCNCVPGTYRPPSSTGGGGGGGLICTCNKICTCIPVPSDRNVKESFEMTNPMLILQKLAELPIQKWNYKCDGASVRHIGPMAQDFAATFEVGDNDKHIHPVDAQGVAFAAIQGIYQKMKGMETQAQNLQAQLQQQQSENKKLKAKIEALEQLVKSQK